MTRSFFLLSVLVAAAAVERRVTSEPSPEVTVRPAPHAVALPRDAGPRAPGHATR